MLKLSCYEFKIQSISYHNQQTSDAFQMLIWWQVYHEYQVIGRKQPTEKEPQPKIYRMKIFAKNPILARSKFWHFLSYTKKVKRSNGEIISCNEVSTTSNHTTCFNSFYLYYLYYLLLYKRLVFYYLLIIIFRSMKDHQESSRTSVSSSDMTVTTLPTISTRNTEIVLELVL